MSDELLRRAERRLSQAKRNPHVAFDASVYAQDVGELAARVRELESALAESRKWHDSGREVARLLTERAERAEAERDALRALLRRVLSCGLNEYPPGVGFTPSRQERLAGELARDISAALAGGKHD